MRGTLPAETFQAAAEINVTPMIDVMLVLLIIFMVVTPAMVPALPRAVHSEYQPDRHPTLTIDAHGGLSLDAGGRTERVAPGRLRARLGEVYARTPADHVIYLKADRNVGYGTVLAALDEARGAGVRRVAAITAMPRREGRR
jgi:biopolymer transport protein ExbD